MYAQALVADVEFSKVPNHLGCSTKIGFQIRLFYVTHGGYEHFLITSHVIY